MTRPRLLLYAMYDPSAQNNAPRVRIAMLSAALAEGAELTVISGTPRARARAAWRWLRASGWRSVDGVYVESSTASAHPADLLFLASARLRGVPVGVYFRDAYQLFRDLFPIRGWRQRLSDLAWRTSMPMLRRLATVRYAPSAGLAAALRLRDAVLLPPGTDPALPNLGAGTEPLVGAIVSVAPRTGFETLLGAVDRVRSARPDVRLRVVAAAVDPATAAALPDWVEVVHANRDGLAAALADARVCVLPLPITRYTDLAVAVRLMDLLAFGKPVVTTASAESRRIAEETGAALVVADEPDAMAAAITRVLDEPGLAEHLAARAREVATSPEWTWADRASTILRSLGLRD